MIKGIKHQILFTKFNPKKKNIKRALNIKAVWFNNDSHPLKNKQEPQNSNPATSPLPPYSRALLVLL